MINCTELEWPSLKAAYSMIEAVTRTGYTSGCNNDEKERILLQCINAVEGMLYE